VVRLSSMQKGWLVIIGAGLALILAGLIVKGKFFSKSGMAALSVSSEPKSVIYLDGEKIGETDFFDDKMEAKEYLVRLVPKEDESLIPWEMKVALTPNLLTAINHNFAATESASSGDITWMEKIGNKESSSLVVVSVPDQATIKVDGEPRGFAPVLTEDLKPGSHQVTVAAPGYKERTLSAKTVAGYKLIVSVQLAQKIEGIAQVTPSLELNPATTSKFTATSTPSPKSTPKVTPEPTVAIEKPYVMIKETPTGWLRVRQEPSTSATELTKINPGETYPYLNEEENGWYKIEYATDKEGWISKVYAELVE